jgi:reverse gyrase
LLIERHQLNKDQIKLLNQHIEKNIVTYLKRKYPMTESTDVNKALDEAVKPIDKTEAQENDLLQKSEVVFSYR